MLLDDPRWHKSWRQKPCLVFEVSEARARAAASEFFSTLDRSLHGSVGANHGRIPTLSCGGARTAAGRASTAATITDLGGEVINRADYEGV
jgi:hypothetical protein